jgi:high-affinity nickel permease
MTSFVAASVALVGAGFLLGLKHALDADHVAVVTTMVSQSKNLKKASLLGVFWGLGHTAALFMVGLIVLLVKVQIPERVALAFEFTVGLVVVGFGVDLLRKIARGQIHAHRHSHDGSVHTHIHSHALQSTHQHNHRALAVGALHGLAGSAALALLVLSTVQSTLQGIVFILIFGVGSILGMVIISSVIGLPFLLTSRFTKINAIIQALAGTASVAVGIFIILTISRTGQLFP